ncbi:MAG: hypothetical protein ABI670_09415 [Chloroflexota bacterium]
MQAALLWVVIGVSVASSWSDWLGIPDIADYLTPWHMLFAFWTLASVFPALAFFWAARRHKFIAALFGFTGLLLFVLLVDVSLRMSVHGVIAPAALLYVAPLALGGVLLGWAIASRRRFQARYVVAWLVLMATLGQGLYLLEMSAPMYIVEHLLSVPTSSLEYAQSVSLVSQATWAQIRISAFYLVLSLALLLVPLMRSASGMLPTSLGAILTRLLRVHPDINPGARVSPHTKNTHYVVKRV